MLTLRFVEGWEYHEIAPAKAVPIGTVQRRVFNPQEKAGHTPEGPWFSQKSSSLIRGKGK